MVHSFAPACVEVMSLLILRFIERIFEFGLSSGVEKMSNKHSRGFMPGHHSAQHEK